jgi:hypothetical protein
MNPLHWVIQFVIQFAFGCHHRHVSRVFTINQRTYKVCLDCGREFGLPDADITDAFVIPDIRAGVKEISRDPAA